MTNPQQQQPPAAAGQVVAEPPDPQHQQPPQSAAESYSYFTSPNPNPPQATASLPPAGVDAAGPPSPPDKGYAWFIVLGAFLCHGLVDGFCYSFFSVARDRISESFAGRGPAELSLIGSTVFGVYMLFGPTSSALANTFGCRPIIMLGAAASAAVFCGASFVTNYYAFVFVFGVLGGASLGLVYLPAVVTVGFWFERRRAIATGIGVCGSGVGTAAVALATDQLVDQLTWRGALMVLAGVLFNCVVAGSLLMPLDRYYDILAKRELRRLARGEPRVKGNIMRKLVENKKRERNISQGSLNGWIITTANRVEPPPPDFDDRPMLSMEAIHRIAENVLRRKTPGYSAATAAAAASGAGSRRLTSRHSFLAEAAATAKGSLSQLAATVRGGGGGVSGVSGGISGGAGVGDFAQSQTSLAVGGVSSNDPAANQPHLVGAPLQPHTALNSEVPTPDQSNFASGTSLAGTATSAAGGPAAINGAAMALLSGSTEITEEVREAIGRSLRREVLRPLNRKDVFHSGSLRHVAEYCRATRAPGAAGGGGGAGGRDFYRSATTVPVDAGRPAAPARSALRKMLSPGMLRSPTFCLLMLGSVFTVLGYLQFYHLIRPYAITRGISSAEATNLLVLTGIANSAGRMLFAWAGDRSWSDCLWVNNLTLIGAGLATAAVPLFDSFTSLAVCACCYGVFTSAWTSLRTILVVDLMGLDRLTNAFGLLLLIQGAGLVVGPPLTAAFANGWAPAAALGPVGGPGLAASFYAAGALLALSGLAGFPLRALSQWEAARAARAAAANNDETASYSGSHSYHGNNNNYSPNAASTFLVGGEIADYGQQQQPMHTPPPTIIVAPAADSAASTSAAPATGIEPLTYHDQFPAHEPPPLEEIESRI
ncbi:hypothetical protein BOX15_Mlig010000g1 [Macrostomum lignano]|uniref:Major facilitator superfamily (MFS) profile domain-containing protein n=1 Tax=Macrostomum lignano TaxID=282301 RepID=A0A267FZJ3_9PLAT|nr:hypothetical protein BOX15_Mlig010000g1 [Macrostomum lignano]